jgi:hypothetical protein
VSFLTPLYLAGLAAVALPFVLHLLRRTPRQRVPFSSLMFLAAVPPRTTRRSRLENIPLLLLRAAALMLLALSFARPYWREASSTTVPAAAGRRIVLLVDTSASMRRGDLWRQALARAETIGKAAAVGDRVAVFTFDNAARPLITFTEWVELPPAARPKLMAQRLAEVQPGWAATHLDTALLAAATYPDEDGAESATAAGRRLVLISDLQAGSHLERLSSGAWPEGIDVALERLDLPPGTNAGLQLIQAAADGVAGDEQVRPRVRVSNAADSARADFRIHWADDSAVNAIVQVHVPAGESRVIPGPSFPADRSVGRLVLEGDEHPFDNELHCIPSVPEEVTIAYLGGDAADDPREPRYYLERAFPGTTLRSVQIVTPSTRDGWTEASLRGMRLCVIQGAAATESEEPLRQFLAGGGTGLYVLAEDSDAQQVARLVGREDLPTREASGEEYALLQDVDFSHPLLAPFAAAQFGDFTKIHFWKHRRIELDQIAEARIIARFDDRSPALAELPVGRGRLLLLTSGWGPGESQWALSSKFAPLLNAILDQSQGAAQRPPYYAVGEPVSLPASIWAGNDSAKLRLPDQTDRALTAAEPVFQSTAVPGVYTIRSPIQPWSFAVNLAPEESKTNPLSPEDLERFGVRLAQLPVNTTLQAAAERQLKVRELERRQQLWRWLIVAVLGCLILETWLAGRHTGRRDNRERGAI